MRPTFSRANLLVFGVALLLWLPGSGLGMTASDDAEDSPLYGESRQKAFAQFVSLERLPSTAGGANRLPATAISDIIVVEGTRWHTVPAGAGPVVPEGGSRRGPLPRDVTISDSTCIYWPTCNPVTCMSPTCMVPTCAPYPTCGIIPTCMASPSCGTALTCMNHPTCSGTCAPAACPTTLFGVIIPQAGVIQMSFGSSSGLTYTLLYCTNLSATNWLTATSAVGNGGTMTFFHTNNASASLYRLSISR